jgi:inorganic pyrophosphatase
VHAYIEITPFSTIKYEIDKESGYLKVDRPQASNSLPPSAYGFIPRTYCGARVAALADVDRGDGDPLDICVLSERPIDRSDILLCGRVIGGMLMVDRGEADDKIVAVLDRDPVMGSLTEMDQLPRALVDRLRHYFLTYKLDPNTGVCPVQVDRLYGAEQARGVLKAAMEDYRDLIGW